MAKMTTRQSYYFLASFLAFLYGGQGVHWLITPTSAAASNARWWAVAAQAALGTVLGFWCLLKMRRAGRAG